MDLVVLGLPHFEGSTPSPVLPTELLVISQGEPIGVVIDAGDLGNHPGANPQLVVTLADALCNVDSAVLFDAIDRRH